MKISHVEAVVQASNPAMQSLLNSLVDVPEQFRADAQPTWAGTYKVKRHLFNWLNRFGKVQLYLVPTKEGVLHYRVELPILKGWTFSLTPELVYLMSNIVVSVEHGVAADLTFIFRGRRIFLPFELTQRFIRSMDAVFAMHKGRVASIHEAMNNLRQQAQAQQEQEQDGEEKEPEVKRVLH